jgi:hypothetical protein
MRRGWLAGLLAASLSAAAVTPVTPHLAPASHKALADKLAAVAFPETGRNSVFIALGQALGMKPAATTYRYEQKYAHLPIVDVEVVPDSGNCVGVRLVAIFRPGVKYGPTRVRGRYCLTGLGEWTASDQELTQDRAR